MHAMQMRVEGCCTWAQASDRNLSCDVGVAVISLISSSRFSIIVFMASRADSRARSFSAHLQETGERLSALAQARPEQRWMGGAPPAASVFGAPQLCNRSLSPPPSQSLPLRAHLCSVQPHKARRFAPLSPEVSSKPHCVGQLGGARSRIWQ